MYNGLAEVGKFKNSTKRNETERDIGFPNEMRVKIPALNSHDGRMNTIKNIDNYRKTGKLVNGHIASTSNSRKYTRVGVALLVGLDGFHKRSNGMAGKKLAE